VAQHGSYPNPPYNSDIVLKDLNNPYYDEWSTVSTAEQVSPDLYCEPNLCYLVWQDSRNGNWDIYVYNVVKDVATQVTTNTAGQQNPAVYGGRIVYQDDRNGNWDIYMAELAYAVQPTPVPTSPPTPGGPIESSQKGRGALYVVSHPSGATILINGTDYGETSGFIDNIPAGIQNLTLIKPGYQPETRFVDVPKSGLKVLASITLSRDEGEPPEGTGTLYVASRPSGAMILINGTEYGITNTIVYGVPAGHQNLTLVKEGYQPGTVTVNVPRGGRKILASIPLSKEDGEPS
jgi:beta propeller repeat protein